MHLKTILLSISGIVFLILGAIGLFLPIWPTTPFMLLSTACLSATPRIRARVMALPLIREYIRNHTHRSGLSVKTVLFSLGYLWGMLLLSMYLVKQSWVMLLLCGVGAAVTAHIVWISKKR